MTTMFPLQASRKARALVLTMTALVAALVFASCSKHGSPTSPYGGGTTGGGGTGGGTGTQFDVGPFALGQSLVLAFPNAGTFGYHCRAHANLGMTGTVQVDATGADSVLVQVGSPSFMFTPSIAHIRTGAHVRWVNASNLTNHTVTS